MMKKRYFECSKCGAIIEGKQLDAKKYFKPAYIIPIECHEDQGGCGRIAKFRELRTEWVEAKKKNPVKR